MKLNCPNCKKTIPVADVNVERGFAKCVNCEQVYRLTKLDSAHAERENKPPSLLPTPKPDLFIVDQSKRQLQIHWRWNEHEIHALFMILFAIVWWGILLFFLFPAILKPPVDPLRVLGILCFPHVWLGLWLVYGSLTTIFNRTIVTICDGLLSIHHRPIWYWGNRAIPLNDIRQLYCTEQYRFPGIRFLRSNGTRYFQLNALLSDGTKLSLLSRPEIDEVLFLEQEIENYLGIADQKVMGELKTVRRTPL